MSYEILRRRVAPIAGAAALLAVLVIPAMLHAQGRGGGQRGGPPPTGRASAPFDITGTWVSLITDDYEYRMVTPAKGQAQFVPTNQAAQAIINAWDPDKDTAAGNQCKGYGAAGVMRLPQRARISWQDDNTLKIELDNGTQTRLVHFNVQGQGPLGALTDAQKGERSWQGYSIGTWEGGGARGARGNTALHGALQVVTTNLKSGYLRKNGVPYSDNAVYTEWFNILEDRGTSYLAIQLRVDDPTYLTQPFFRTVQYKKEPNDSKFNPVPCSAK